MAYSDEGSGNLQKKPPSLVDLCVRTAIDNVRYLGDVGGIELNLLERILEHCTIVDQLMHIEKSTTVTDLSPVTDKLWKRFYEKEFGTKNAEVVVERMKQKKVAFRWMQLYEAKMKEVEETERKRVDRIKKLYEKEDARKQSRQVRICTKVPPSSNKRSFYGGSYDVSNWKSNIMKKSRIELLKSPEVRNLAATRKNTFQRNRSISTPLSPPVKPNSFSGKGAASTPKPPSPPVKPNSFSGKGGASTPKSLSPPVKPNSFSGKGAASTPKPLSPPVKPNSFSGKGAASTPKPLSPPVKPNSFSGKGAASTPKPLSPPVKPNSFSGKGAASTPKQANPFQRTQGRNPQYSTRACQQGHLKPDPTKGERGLTT